MAKDFRGSRNNRVIVNVIINQGDLKDLSPIRHHKMNMTWIYPWSIVSVTQSPINVCFSSCPTHPALKQSTEWKMMPGYCVAQTAVSAVLQLLFDKIASSWLWSAYRVCLLSGPHCEIHQPISIVLCWPRFRPYGKILWVAGFVQCPMWVTMEVNSCILCIQYVSMTVLEMTALIKAHLL